MATKKKDDDAPEGTLPLATSRPSVEVTETVKVFGLWYGPGIYRDLPDDVAAALTDATAGKAAPAVG